jgi:hypothetical protein
MKNYVYLYFNSGFRDNVSPEESKAAWGAWFGKLGDKLVDAGNPFGPGGQVVEKSGVSPITSWPETGYSIVKAESMAAAVELAKDCPVLEEPDGAVRVHEAMPM